MIKSEKSLNKIDIVIISYNCKEFTLKCINTIYETYPSDFVKIVVVDNASKDDTVESIKSFYPEVEIIQNEKNLGYASAVNIGVKATKNQFIIISNPDVEYHSNALKYLIHYLELNKRVGAAGPMQIFPNGSWQFCYGDVPSVKLSLKLIFFIYSLQNISNFLLYKLKIHRTKPKKVGYIDGAVIATTRDAFDSVNGFDEDYFLYTEELDFCYRLTKKGWDVMHLPNCTVTHFRGGSSAKMGVIEENVRIFLKSKILFCKKHLSKAVTKFYIISEIIYAYEILFFWKIFAIFKHFRDNSSFKITTMKLFVKIWKEEYKKL